MRKYFFEILAATLTLGSLVFFVKCVSYIGDHEYLGAMLVLGAGVAVLQVGAELAKLALVERD
jgi:hypothetical protein